MDPTGKVYFSTIEDNLGYFSFPNVAFESNFVQPKIEGKYYNEVFNGVNNFSEIILNSIVDITDNSLLNINIITHLVQARTLELVKNGAAYNIAYEQSLSELLSVFCLEGNKHNRPEHYDISSSDSDGGVLLLISSIIQSNIGSGLNFTEFLTLLTGDFKDNGIIDDSLLQRTLGTSGLVLDIQEIRNNLISRYSELGQTINPYIGQQFLSEFNRLNPYPTVFDGTFPNTTGDFINLVGVNRNQ